VYNIAYFGVWFKEYNLAKYGNFIFIGAFLKDKQECPTQPPQLPTKKKFVH